MSSERARQLHSLILNDEIDTWDDWKVVATKKPIFNEPELKSNYVDIPGADGQLDLTEVLTGYPTFNDRTGTMQFFLYDDSMSALTKLTIIRNYLHGKVHKIVLNDEPEYYYIGRLMMHDSHPTKEGEYAVFEVDYILDPYKVEITDTTEDWLWDPFNFETGVIREYGQIKVENDPVTVTVIGSRKPTIPKFEVTRNTLPVGVTPVLMLDFNDKPYELDYGTNIFPEIVLMDAEYEMTFTGNAFVTIDFRGGSL